MQEGLEVVLVDVLQDDRVSIGVPFKVRKRRLRSRDIVHVAENGGVLAKRLPKNLIQPSFDLSQASKHLCRSQWEWSSLSTDLEGDGIQVKIGSMRKRRSEWVGRHGRW